MPSLFLPTPPDWSASIVLTTQPQARCCPFVIPKLNLGIILKLITCMQIMEEKSFALRPFLVEPWVSASSSLLETLDSGGEWMRKNSLVWLFASLQNKWGGPGDDDPIGMEMGMGMVGMGMVMTICFKHLKWARPVQWLRLRASTAGGTGLIPGQGTKIPHAARP